MLFDFIARVRGKGSVETKGNNFVKLDLEEALAEKKIVINDTTKKILELEYVYAKESAISNLNQRSPVMQVFFAAVAILVVAITAVIRDAGNLISHNEIILFFASLLVAISLFTMRAMILLRKDWFDFCSYMATIKVFVLFAEELDVRKRVFQYAYYHDPFHVPSRQLKTNFFFLSYAMCMQVFATSIFLIFLVLLSNSLSIEYTGTFHINSLISIFVIILVVAIAHLAARISWRFILEAPRSKLSMSPRFAPKSDKA